MASLTFNSNIWGGKVLLLQYGVSYGAGESEYIPTLEVVFPDQSTLAINIAGVVANFGTIDHWDSNASAEYWSNIKLDLSKWNWLTLPEDSASLLLVSLDYLKDIANYPGWFSYTDSDGIAIDFPDIEELPVGIYKVTMKGAVTGSLIAMNEVRRVMCLSAIEDHISEYITEYTELKSDDASTRQEVDELRDMVMKLMMIEYAARYDFSRNKYADSDEKIQALKLICESGVYSYKSGH